MEPVIVSTWSFGMKANEVAWPMLHAGRDALDAIEAGCRAVESDPSVDSVGVGGLPDASGEVSLDACVMRSPSECGSVAYVRNYPNPVSIARRVMEKTVHVMLAGEGAESFAAREGFEKASLLTDAARAEWERWSANPTADEFQSDRYRGWLPPRNIEEIDGAGAFERPHDTICLLGRDRAGRLAGACSTSGMAFKVPGRVGDSPIVGHALYVHPEYGAAAATGTGEVIMQMCASFLAVEFLRSGLHVADAARAVIDRTAETIPMHPDHQVAVLLLSPDGDWSAAALRPGYRTAVRTADRNELVAASYVAFPESKNPDEGRCL